ncbi:hypothetical protein [Embleya sp. AB8]|uniref:hypothetical protein n=1 Tax=Embleya sp. AB8 TaxID=3156304 RepID=UPI003C78F627
MNTRRPASRIGARTIVPGVAAVLITGLPAAAQAAPTSRAATTITCNAMEADLPDAFGRDCDSGQWGPSRTS